MTIERRQRILIVTRNLPPLVGGMERLNWHMAAELAKIADVRVIGPEGSAALAPRSVEVREVPPKPLWKFLLVARRCARKEARRFRPDIVLAGSGLTAPLARSAARACGAKAVAYVHGLDVAVKHHVYRAIWLPAIRRMDRVIANSHATAELCRGIGVNPTRIGIVHPGVDLPNASEAAPDLTGSSFRTPRSGDPESSSFGCLGVMRTRFRQRHNLSNRPLLLSVGRLSARKGLREFVERALPRIVTVHPDVMLLIVGASPKDALHAEAQTPDIIRAAAARAGVADNLRFLGSISDNELASAFLAANVHVFPVREIAGDPEGFGMVAVESAAHGLPTVAFATGGVVDAVAEGESGHLVSQGDYAMFAHAVLQTFADGDALRSGCLEFAQQFAWPRFGEQILAQLGTVELNPAVGHTV